MLPTCSRCGHQATTPTAVISGLCRDCREAEFHAGALDDARARLRALASRDFLVLDTETTGLGPEAEIVEVALVARDGTVLLEQTVRPRCGTVPAEAVAVHGLDWDELADAPPWPQVWPRLRELSHGRTVVAWNARFDARLLRQSSRAWGLRGPHPYLECAMRLYARGHGVPSGWLRLERAAREGGLLDGRQGHRSAADAQLVAALVRRAVG